MSWGVVFAQDADPVYYECLRPLIRFRQDQTGGRTHFHIGCDEDVDQFLDRYGLTDCLPEYLLLVGDHQQIPSNLEHALAVQTRVGRLDLSAPADYRRYARNLVRFENRGQANRSQLIHGEDLSSLVQNFQNRFRYRLGREEPETLAAFETEDLSGLMLMVQHGSELETSAPALLTNPGGCAHLVILQKQSNHRILGDPACLRHLSWDPLEQVALQC